MALVHGMSWQSYWFFMEYDGNHTSIVHVNHASVLWNMMVITPVMFMVCQGNHAGFWVEYG